MHSLSRYAVVGEPLRPTGTSIADIVGDKVAGLAALIADVSGDIRARKELSVRLLSLSYEHYAYVSTKLHELDIWPTGVKRGADGERSALERQIDILKAEARQEARQCFTDVMRLKEELRRWQKEYRDLASRTRFIVGDVRRPMPDLSVSQQR